MNKGQMNRRQLLGAAASMGGLALFPVPGFALSSLPTLQALADRYVTEKKVSGVVIGVGIADSAPIFLTAGTLGFDRDQPVSASSIWRIYSMTKPLTGALTVMLITEGKLGLDQPIADFLPAFASMRVATNPSTSLESTPAKTPITVRHLLTHTSGLTYYFEPSSAVTKSYRTHGLMPGVRTNGREPGDGASPTTLQAFAETAAKLPLVAEPGTAWHYGISTDVLAAVVEQAAGIPFETLLEDRIIGPAGMADTGFAVPGADLHRLATNYFVQDGKLVVFDVPPGSEYATPAAYPAGGAGLVSTAADYLKFMRMFCDAGQVGSQQVMSPEAASLAVSNLLPAGVFYEGNQGFGAGGRVVIAPGGGILGSYSWGGLAGTLTAAVPAKRISAVLMTQYMPQQAYPLPVEFNRALAADLYV